MTVLREKIFGKAPEPDGEGGGGKAIGFSSIHKHEARTPLRFPSADRRYARLMGRAQGASTAAKESVAIRRGPPARLRRLRGTIPEGEYGGRTVMVWDKGNLRAARPMRRRFESMERPAIAAALKFELKGGQAEGAAMPWRGRANGRAGSNGSSSSGRRRSRRPPEADEHGTRLRAIGPFAGEIRREEGEMNEALDPLAEDPARK